MDYDVPCCPAPGALGERTMLGNFHLGPQRACLNRLGCFDLGRPKHMDYDVFVDPLWRDSGCQCWDSLGML